MSNRNYYVYFYTDPRDGVDFYVGKGCEDRMYSHLYETGKYWCNEYKHAKIDEIINAGFAPIIWKKVDNITSQQALNLEKIFVRRIGRLINNTGTLTNISEGGDFCPALIPEVGRKISLATKGEKHHMWGIRGEAHYNYGRKKTEKQKEKQRQVARRGKDHHYYGTHRTKEQKEYHSKIMTGRKDSPETIERKRIGMLGKNKDKIPTLETREKYSKAKIGKKRSKASCDKQSETIQRKKLLALQNQKL